MPNSLEITCRALHLVIATSKHMKELSKDDCIIVQLKKVEYDYWISKGHVVNPVNLSSDVSVCITLQMWLDWKEDKLEKVADIAIKENWEEITTYFLQKRFKSYER
jgi:hypothetical protein